MWIALIVLAVLALLAAVWFSFYLAGLHRARAKRAFLDRPNYNCSVAVARALVDKVDEIYNVKCSPDEIQFAGLTQAVLRMMFAGVRFTDETIEGMADATLENNAKFLRTDGYLEASALLDQIFDQAKAIAGKQTDHDHDKVPA